MTFKEAVRSLDNEGKYGAKRPSMLGYAVKAACAEEGDNADGRCVVTVKGRDKDTVSFSLGGDGGFDICGDDSVTLDREQLYAFIFAGDWDLADAAELEKARTGAGGM